MSKISHYFSHDYTASDDVKMLFLRQQLGMEGIGIYWYIVEKLAQAGGKLPLKIVPVLAMQMQTPDVKVTTVINAFELFEVHNNEFFSNRLLRSIEKMESIQKRLHEAGVKGSKKRWSQPQKKDKPNPNSFI